VSQQAGGGVRIIVPTRHLHHGQALQSLPSLELVKANVHDLQQLRACLAGADAVIHLVAILHGNEASFERVHVTLPRVLVDACRFEGVRRIIHVSALGVQAQAPSGYLRSKAAGEQVLRDSGLDVTMLRPSVIFGAEDRLLNLFASLQAVAPFVPLAGADAQFQPVWVEDVARAVAACLDRSDTIGQVIECAGPAACTLADLVRLAGRLSGHPRRVLPLPVVVARLQAAFMRLLPGEPLISQDNLDSMKVPNLPSGNVPGLTFLGIEPAALEAVAPEYLGVGHGPNRMLAWRARRG
jgi:NADH dehydrogenase